MRGAASAAVQLSGAKLNKVQGSTSRCCMCHQNWLMMSQHLAVLGQPYQHHPRLLHGLCATVHLHCLTQPQSCKPVHELHLAFLRHGPEIHACCCDALLLLLYVAPGWIPYLPSICLLQLISCGLLQITKSWMTGLHILLVGHHLTATDFSEAEDCPRALLRHSECLDWPICNHLSNPRRM